MTTICVATHDLRRACRAVVKHADTKDPYLDRIRFTIDRHNITVTATDGNTSGLAIASVWESEHDLIPIPEDGEIVDLEPEQIRKILEVFKASADKNDETGSMLQLEIGDNYIQLTDVSGLPGIPGESLKLPRMETYDGFPDIAHTIARIRALPTAVVPTLTIAPSVIFAFIAAANAYKEQIRITAHGESRIVSVEVGESFLGLLTPTVVTDEDRERYARWADSWEIRLPAPDSVPRNATKPDSAPKVDLKSGTGLVLAGKDSDE